MGIHGYATSNAHVHNVTADGNIVFNNGVISLNSQNVDNILFASGTGLENILVQNNYTYHTPARDQGYSRVGWQFDNINKTVAVRNNYWMGGFIGIMLNRWTAANFTGNTVYSKSKLLALLDVSPGENPRNYVWDRNTVLRLRPVQLHRKRGRLERVAHRQHTRLIQPLFIERP